jgi:4-diphosphocytidyl-2-C-methyl-D-erythritol kinase
MPVAVRSFAKINLGLCIGVRRDDGFHELRTIYQTVAPHDRIRVDVGRGTGIEVRCKHPRVPEDESNTCYRIAERVLKALKTRGRVVIQIEKRMPVQGGLGAASSNAVAAMLGLERALKQALTPEQRFAIAAEVGSDLPLFLIGGTVLGVGRGQEVFPLPDLPPLDCVLATPELGISTPQAFADWDARLGDRKLTEREVSSRIEGFSHTVYAWLRGSTSGVPAAGGSRAETLLLDLVRAGIENDFERVVFPQHPELRDVKRVLEHAGARYASLSGSGSAVYGLFDSPAAAEAAVVKLAATDVPAQATKLLPRAEYWQDLVI